MTQNVQLQNGIVEKFKSKVGGDGAGTGVIRRVLNGGKIIDIFITRHNDDTAGMLSRRSLYFGAACNQPFHMSPV